MQIKVMSRSVIFLSRSFSSLSRSDELYYNADQGEYYASPSQRTGVAGGAGEAQGEHEQQAQAGHHFPPAKYFGRPDAVQAQVVK